MTPKHGKQMPMPARSWSWAGRIWCGTCKSIEWPCKSINSIGKITLSWANEYKHVAVWRHLANPAALVKAFLEAFWLTSMTMSCMHSWMSSRAFEACKTLWVACAPPKTQMVVQSRSSRMRGVWERPVKRRPCNEVHGFKFAKGPTHPSWHRHVSHCILHFVWDSSYVAPQSRTSLSLGKVCETVPWLL